MDIRMPSLKLSATLSVYFAKQFTMYVLCMFIAITAVVYLVDTIELLRRFASKDNLNVILVLKMAALKAPEISQKIFPFSVLFGSTMFFTKMVKNKEFTAAIAEHNNSVKKAIKEGKEPPRVSEYIGECIYKIATRLSTKPNFINYSYRDEMICDGFENCLQ